MDSFRKKYQQGISFFLSIVKEHKKSYVYYIALLVVVALISTIIPQIARLETDQLVEKATSIWGIQFDTPFNLFILVVLIIAIIQLIQSFLSKIKRHYETILTKIIEENYIISLIKRLHNIQLGMYINKRNQKFISSFWNSNFANNIKIIVFDGIITHGIQITGIIIAFSYLNIWLFLLILATVIVSFFINQRERKQQNKFMIESRYTHEYKLRNLRDILIDSFDKIKISGGYNNAIFMYQDLINDKIAFEKRRQKNNTFSTILSTFNENIGELLIKLIIGFSIIKLGGSVGLMTMTLMYITQIRSFFYTIFDSKNIYEDTIDELQRLEIYLTMTAPKVYNEAGNIENIETITLENVSFAYPKISQEEIASYKIMLARLKKLGEKNPSERIKDRIHFLQDAFTEDDSPPIDVIQNVSYTFKKGKIYGIVGQNGAGKTTLAHMIMGYFANYGGDIIFNQTEQRTLNMFKHDTLFGVITQEPFIIYSFSIRQNILLGVTKDYSDEDLQEYLERFGLRKKITKLRKGLDSDIGYDGDFSGGEKQLLVLLRIILQDRPILIIDEGTNQLDANNESLVMQELLKNKHDKIIFFITHRMTTIKKADIIVCMENNTFAAIGSHDQLITQNTVYSKFRNKQVEESY